MALGDLKGLSELAKAATAKKGKGKEVLTVPITDVVAKDQVRKRFRNIEELAATLLVEGQQTPIIVSPPNAQGKYVIQKGERRWRACQHAGIDTIDLIVNDKAQEGLEAVAGELIENIQRDDLTPIEIAEALEGFVEAGWKQQDIAKRIGKAAAFVSTHLSLLRLPDCVRTLYDSEVCADTETLNNLRLLFDLSPGRCRAVCTAALRDGLISRKQSRELLNDARQRAEAQSSRGDAKRSRQDGAGQASGANGDVQSANQEWKSARPGELVFVVNVSMADEVLRGIIMTDRVSMTPATVWVKIMGDHGGEEQVQVATTAITLVSVEV